MVILIEIQQLLIYKKQVWGGDEMQRVCVVERERRKMYNVGSGIFFTT